MKSVHTSSDSRTTRRKTGTVAPSAQKRSVVATYNKQNEELNKQIEQLKIRLASSQERSAIETYEAACVVQKIIDDGTRYGDGAIKKLAPKLELSEKTLYRWADVARSWPAKEDVSKLLARRSEDGF
jgi:predicted transcriptional regulator YheO